MSEVKDLLYTVMETGATRKSRSFAAAQDDGFKLF
jgi:hypothetical protein